MSYYNDEIFTDYEISVAGVPSFVARDIEKIILDKVTYTQKGETLGSIEPNLFYGAYNCYNKTLERVSGNQVPRNKGIWDSIFSLGANVSDRFLGTNFKESLSRIKFLECLRDVYYKEQRENFEVKKYLAERELKKEYENKTFEFTSAENNTKEKSKDISINTDYFFFKSKNEFLKININCELLNQEINSIKYEKTDKDFSINLFENKDFIVLVTEEEAEGNDNIGLDILKDDFSYFGKDYIQDADFKISHIIKYDKIKKRILSKEKYYSLIKSLEFVGNKKTFSTDAFEITNFNLISFSELKIFEKILEREINNDDFYKFEKNITFFKYNIEKNETKYSKNFIYSYSKKIEFNKFSSHVTSYDIINETNIQLFNIFTDEKIYIDIEFLKKELERTLEKINNSDAPEKEKELAKSYILETQKRIKI